MQPWLVFVFLKLKYLVSLTKATWLCFIFKSEPFINSASSIDFLLAQHCILIIKHTDFHSLFNGNLQHMYIYCVIDEYDDVPTERYIKRCK